jgi:glycosyltransferase involved in cell wall biosynthesis
LKVAVYTIALNEEQFVADWYESAKDADYLLIADTGSKDRTIELAKDLGITVINIGIRPWRFDDARNASLAAIPLDIDYCIALDMDEVLLPGWRKELEKAFEEGWTRPRYQYTWSWTEDGKPGLQYGGDKIHTRQGYRWKHPVHEVLISDRLVESQGWVGLEIHHHADNSKPRSQYLPLLAQSVVEDPYDDRNAFYYARELFFYGQLEEAALMFEKHLSLPKAVWPPERAASMRYLAKCKPNEARYWIETAVKESPGRREALVELAQYFYAREDFQNSYWASIDAIKIEEKPLDYLCEEFAWGALPYDLASICAWNLKMVEEALKYGKIALELDPANERLANNLSYYLAASSS